MAGPADRDSVGAASALLGACLDADGGSPTGREVVVDSSFAGRDRAPRPVVGVAGVKVGAAAYIGVGLGCQRDRQQSDDD